MSVEAKVKFSKAPLAEKSVKAKGVAATYGEKIGATLFDKSTGKGKVLALDNLKVTSLSHGNQDKQRMLESGMKCPVSNDPSVNCLKSC
jgi:hypothetical protein